MTDRPRGDAPVALVTGAGRGLGAAVATALDAVGFRLVLTDIARPDPEPAGTHSPGTAPRGTASRGTAPRGTAPHGTASRGAGAAGDEAPGTAVAADPARPPGAGYPVSSRAELAAVAAACRDAVAVPADVRTQADMDRVVDEARVRYGRLDAAVAAAGVIAGGPPLWETDDEAWRSLLDVNLGGVFHLARAAVPVLLRAPAGRFVAISSAAGTRPLGRLAAYSASKHAVVGLVRSLAADLAGTAVTANVVCPGSMDTVMLAESARIYDLDEVGGFAGHAYLRRLLDPAEVAAAVAFLCSPAAGAMTGAVVPVDGGFTG